MEPKRLLPGYPAAPTGVRKPAELDYTAHPFSFQSDTPVDLETDGLFDYLRILANNRGTVFLAAVLGMVAAALLTLPQTPVYRARTTLEIQGVNNEFLNSKQVSPVNDDGSNSNVMADIQTQIKIINSEFLVDRVVDRLVATGKLSSTAPLGQGSLWRMLLRQKAPASSNVAEQLRQTALKNLTVSQISQTRMIEVYFKSPDPQLAADFVNVLDAEYIESNVEARWKMSEQTSKWLGRQIDDTRGKLERSELELQRYARRAGLLFSSGQLGNTDRTNVSDEKLRQMQEQLSRAQDLRAMAQSQHEIAKAAAPDTLADVLSDQSLRDLQRQITDLRRQAADLSSVYTDKNERVQRIEVQIVPLEAAFQKQRAAILERIENDYQTTLRHEHLLRADYDAQVGVILDQADKSIQYNILKRDVDTNRQLYDSMLQQVKASSVASAIRASNIRIVDPGKVPGSRFTPNLGVNVGLGSIAGLVFGVAFVLIRKSTDRTFQHPGELQFWTKLSELGVIPSKTVQDLYSSPAQTAPLWKRKTESFSLDMPSRQQRTNLLAEAFRTVLTSVLFSGENGTRPQVLVLTSANASEGKTTITTNLALALAEIRLKVLIVDGDLRKPRMHQIFELSNERGLSTLLSEETLPQSALDGIIQSTNIPGVYVLPSGPPTDSAANLLHSPHLHELLTQFRKQFDMILIDTPPAFQLTDSRIVGRLADAVILIARAGHTTRDSAMAVASRFNEDRTHLLGSILNDWTPGTALEGKHMYYGYGKTKRGSKTKDVDSIPIQ